MQFGHSKEIGDPRVELGVKLAQAAGRHTLAAMGRTRVAWKSPGESVTDVGLAIQVRLIEEIETWFSGDGVVEEEGARAPAESTNSSGCSTRSTASTITRWA